MGTQPTNAEIAKKLTEAQRGLVLASEPGGWGRDDCATGADVIGPGRHATARSLVKLGLGEIDRNEAAYPPVLYFNNDIGLAIRTILETSHDSQ